MFVQMKQEEEENLDASMSHQSIQMIITTSYSMKCYINLEKNFETNFGINLETNHYMTSKHNIFTVELISKPSPPPRTWPSRP